MKKIYLVLSLLLFTSLLKAQSTTTVTAVVVDSDSTTWINASCTMSLVPNPNNPTVPSGINQHPSCTVDGSGNLSTTPTQQASIGVNGTSWNLQICPQASVGCSTYNFVASGTSMNISSALSANIKAPRFKPIANSYGYSDAEAILNLIPGSTYYNTTTLTQRIYTGASWISGSNSCSTCVPVQGGVNMTGATGGPPIAGGLNATQLEVNGVSPLLLTGGTLSGPLDVGVPSGNLFTLTNLSSIPTPWTLDVTSPSTALTSITGAETALANGTAASTQSAGLKMGSAGISAALEGTLDEGGVTEANGGPAFLFAGGGILGISVKSKTFQWNNVATSGTPEIVANKPIVGCDFTGNYAESDAGGTTGSQSTGIYSASPFFGNSNLLSCNLSLTTNYFNQGGSGAAPVPLTFSAASSPIPTCTTSAGVDHVEACVSDATACTNGSTYTSGGSIKCRVGCNGTNWIATGASTGCN